MYSSHTAGSAENRPPNTGQHTETADENRPATAKQPEHINHSGIIGNAIPGSKNQQKPSDHDRLVTSNPNRHNFQTISKSCTANFQITEKPKKRYIIRTYTQGSGSAENRRKRPDDHGKRPERNSFQKSATIQIFYGRGFANRYFTEIHRLYASCPDCPDLCPYFYLRKPSKATCNLLQLTADFQRFQRFERIGAGSSNALNAR